MLVGMKYQRTVAQNCFKPSEHFFEQETIFLTWSLKAGMMFTQLLTWLWLKIQIT